MRAELAHAPDGELPPLMLSVRRLEGLGLGPDI